MKPPSEKTPLVQGRLRASPAGRGSPSSSSSQAGSAANGAVGGPPAASPPPTPAKARLHKLHSAPIKDFLSTGTDMDSLRLSYAAKLVLAAVEGRHVESAVDLLVLKGGFVNPLSYRLYSPILVCIILGHLALALWEGGMHPFPLHPAVAAAEACVSLFYAAHILLNLWTFGVKQYRDKKWHFSFTVLAISHLLLMASAALAANSAATSGRTAGVGVGETGAGGAGAGAGATRVVEGYPRLALLGAQALRPMMLISNLQTIRRVFTNVLRTVKRTGNILLLGAVLLAFYSVLGINLFNSAQVSGYDFGRDNFDNFGRALLSLFVLVTEENFPEVADPSFTQRPLVAFPFFVSFLLLFLVVILPLLLGIVLDAYAQQHARQHERYRRKARNALLAAYFILDDDGVRGLSREQLVGVLTTEAGVGIDTEQAEQLWHVIVPEGDRDWQRGRDYMYSRSYSVPVANESTKPWRDPAATAAAAAAAAPYVAGTISSSSSGTGVGGRSSSTTARGVFDIARSRARSLPHGPDGDSGRRSGRWQGNSGGGGGGRMDVRGFLQLADLLHQRVADDGQDVGGGGGGGGRRRPCYLAGFDDDGVDAGAGAGACGSGLGLGSAHAALAGPRSNAGGGARRTSGGSSRGSGGGSFRESEDEDNGDGDGDGEDDVEGAGENSEDEDEEEEGREDEDEEQQCCWSGEEGNHSHGDAASTKAHRSSSSSSSSSSSRSSSSVVGGGVVGGGDGDRGPLSPRQRIERCAWRALGRARVAARSVVGRRWFCTVSRAVAVSLAMLALVWTPLSQQRYDGCLGGREGGCEKKGKGEDEADYRWEDLLRRLEGLVLLAFAGEMAAKVLAVGCRRLWRLHWAHRFDLIALGMCLASYLFVGVPGNRRALYVDRHPALSDVVELPRAVAVLRLVTAFPQLRRLVETLSTVATMLVKIMVLYSCVSYTFAAVGMAIFADATSDLLEPRYSFSTLPEACMALFFMTVSNNWNDLLYPLVNSVRAGYWSSFYFVSYMLFCATMMLDVLVGVVIEGFRVSTKGPDLAPAETLVATAPPSEGTGTKTGSSGAGSDSGGDVDGAWDGGGMSSGNSVGGDEDSAKGGAEASQQQQQQQQSGRPANQRRKRPKLTRKASQRKYTQVKAEDMFRSEEKAWRAQGVWDQEDVRELDEAVKAVEGRLHQAWVSHVRKTGFVAENV